VRGVTRRPGRLPLALALVLIASCASPSATPSGSSAPSTSAAPTAVDHPTPTATTVVPAWRQLTPTGDSPVAREDHTWTIAPDDGIAYLFGGRGSTGAALGDLWAYDPAGNTWSLVTEDGPPARFGHNAAWVRGVGLVIFAGQSGSTFYNDLWAFDPATETWAELPAGGAVPVPRYGSCGAVGPDGRFWMSHGFTQEGQRFADTRAYDFSTDTWTEQTPAGEAPIERCLHACWWTVDGTFVLYAGQTTGTNSLGDLWWLTLGERPGTNAWMQVTPSSGLPPERNLYAAARWGSGTIVFGGQALDGSALNDTWVLADDGGVAASPIAGAPPPGRWAAEWVADAPRGRLLLFGGRDAAGARNDLWELVGQPEE
jgi:galactose oxidase-like protein